MPVQGRVLPLPLRFMREKYDCCKEQIGEDLVSLPVL